MTVAIEDITREEAADVAAWHLDRPKAGDDSGFYSFDLAGWVIGLDPGNEVVAVAVDHDGVRHARIPVATPRPDVIAAHPAAAPFPNCGFQARIGLLGLPPRCTVAVTAVLRDETSRELCTIALRRGSLPTEEAHPAPLVTVCLGRSGTTRFLHLISLHPEIVGYRPLEYETRVSRYWVDVLRALAEPDSFSRTLGADTSSPGWFLGGEGGSSRSAAEEEISRQLASTGVEALAAHAAGQTRDFFRAVAAVEGKTPRYFAEKLNPESGSIELIEEAFAGARIVFLVRDFRDMFASMLAYNRRKPEPGFGRAAVVDDAEHARVVAAHARELAALRRRRGSDALVVKYEDLVNEPAATLDALFSQLGLACLGAELVTKADSLGGKANHRTTAAGRSTVGRWRDDLPAALQETVEREFGDVLEAFGYPDAGTAR